MARSFRFLMALLFVLTMFADAGGHAGTMAQTLGTPDGASQQSQIATLSKRCPNAGGLHVPRGVATCGLDLILTGALCEGPSAANGLRLRYAAAADRPLSPRVIACPHGPPKTVS